MKDGEHIIPKSIPGDDINLNPTQYLRKKNI